MKLYYSDNFCKLYNGNMLDMVDSGCIKPMSIDCIVTDPPYELNFMGKSWDNQGVSFQKETWKVCYDVLKPGGYLLAFGGSRTYHRIACAIEDAGFEIRDTIMWIFGSGFPKSMNIGLAIDKKNGVESNVVGYTSQQDIRCGNYTGVCTNNKEYQRVDWPIKKASNKWDGWGTCLKPAFEPIIVARKPCDGTCLDNVLKYGVGGLNIDECRVGSDSRTYKGCGSSPNKINNQEKGCTGIGMLDGRGKDTEYTVNGRFPANLILTYDDNDYDEVCGGFPITKSTGGSGEASKINNFSNVYNGGWGHDKDCAHLGGLGDEGSASRYFYCAKASKKDREEGCELLDNNYFGASNQAKAEIAIGNVDADMKKFNKILVRKNIHPSVKPAELMQYLVRLVAPKGATILDPFMGSGSTGKAVMFENRERNADYKFIGVELSEEYLPIAEARIKWAEGFETDEHKESPQNTVGKNIEKSQKSDEKMFEKWGFDV